jgi:hypothetical protein
MKQIILRITASLLIVSLAGCALVPDRPPAATPTPSFPPNDYGPQPGDDKLQRDQVLLDVPYSQVVLTGRMPVHVSLDLKGSLSDPCHQLRIVGTRDDIKKQINLEVYSLFAPGKACITVIKPFSATISLGDYTGGHYTVNVNGQIVGDFDA